MDSDLVLIAVGGIAALVGALAAGLWLMRRYNPERAEVIAEALAVVARAISETLSDAEVQALAGWVYDRWGLSQYYSREEWGAFVLRLVRRGEAELPAAQAVMRELGAEAAGR